MKQFRSDRGLTLVELLITIAVLAIVSAIALPVINNVVAASNSNAYYQTIKDADAFINKYSKSGVIAYDGLTSTFTGYIDTDGDNVIDANEKIDTLTLDSKYSVTPTGSASLGGSYTNGGVNSAVIAAPPTAPLAAVTYSEADGDFGDYQNIYGMAGVSRFYLMNAPTGYIKLGNPSPALVAEMSSASPGDQITVNGSVYTVQAFEGRLYEVVGQEHRLFIQGVTDFADITTVSFSG